MKLQDTSGAASPGEAAGQPAGPAGELAACRAALSEALEQKAAMGEILHVLSRSPADAQTVFDMIATSAARLCAAEFCHLFRLERGRLRFVAHYGLTEEALEALRREWSTEPDRGTAAGRAILSGEVERIADIELDGEYTFERVAKVITFRSIAAVPIKSEGRPIGAIAVMRKVAEAFPDRQIDLLKAFADQAGIAMENARLFAEIGARNSELTESLERETATSDILRVISSSPTDAQPVFDMIAHSAARLCGAMLCHVYRFDGERMHFSAHHYDDLPVDGVKAMQRAFPMPPNRGTAAGRAILSGRVEHIPDIDADAEYVLGAVAKQLGHRNALAVPMMRDGVPIGAIALAREAPGYFPDRQVELLQTFADQAVIAVENVRLFRELESRNRDLSEALERQTATSEVLGVISRSANQLNPVLDAIVSTASRLCRAEWAIIFRLGDDGLFHVATASRGKEDLVKFMINRPFAPGRGKVSGRAALERRTVHVIDVLDEPDYDWRDAQAIGQYRTALGVPLLRDGEVIGVIALARNVVRPFSDKEIELVTTFADQAVIAIENVRLFDEVQARTRALARSVDELRALDEVSQAIGSTLDLEVVLATIVSRAVELSGSYGGIVYEFDEAEQIFRARAAHNISQDHLEILGATPVRMGEGAVGRAGITQRPVEVSDVGEQSHLVASQVRAVLAREGMRSLVAIPLVRDGRVLGGLVILRREAGSFASDVVALLRTFAAHSVLAIHNARLFSEIEEKGRELELASRHKSQFLANMSHELRTPLNAILGYTELVLDGIYGEAPQAMQSVLERVQSNGRHLLGLINDVLDLSRIEAGQLTLSLGDYAMGDVIAGVVSAIEPLAGEKNLGFSAEVGPDLPAGRGDERRIAQVLLNLVGNAIKFTDEGEVAILAEARDGTFHIAVRDTGPGIAAGDQVRIFGEFQQADSSSTRRKGGSGLGLAISRRIVEMHGGAIRVESEPGQGSTFIVTLPVIVEQQAGQS
ncbi:GAF domain-containing protein [Stappia sp. F7233]|uniref:histidine kinase n=1 Tax=Stappia albiluteola TaxID=2758565 RepID=A0A839A9M5_9HYPH|nr:GAF domain-containing protein [Stappia albiluteola]MBA5775886.1 GAF domain-containing protein [Stappia albiluteola]